jgi:hypothetical protein
MTAMPKLFILGGVVFAPRGVRALSRGRRRVKT